MMNDNKTLTILFVNTGTHPISTEKVVAPLGKKEDNEKTILDGLNRLGKQCHALIKLNNKMYVFDHTARKGPSTFYYRHEINYHPFSSELV